jgi:hypothetical protein
MADVRTQTLTCITASSYVWPYVIQLSDNAIYGECNMRGGNEMCIQYSSRKGWRKRPLGMSRARQEYNIGIRVWHSVECNQMDRKRETWRPLGITVTKLWAPPTAGDIFNHWETNSFSNRFLGNWVTFRTEWKGMRSLRKERSRLILCLHVGRNIGYPEMFRDFPQCLHAKCRDSASIDHDHFLQNHFQFFPHSNIIAPFGVIYTRFYCQRRKTFHKSEMGDILIL